MSEALELMRRGYEWLNVTPPQDPTTAWPGTKEKVEVLAQRASLGQELWHPEDGADHER